MDYLKAIQDKLEGNVPFKIRDDAYTLIIGLGGSGIRFAGETKDLLLQRYGEAEVNKKVIFYCLDTSDKDRPVNMGDNEFFRMNGLHDDPWVNEWLNPELLKRREMGELKDGSDGAGGIRMVGRWKLFSASPFIMQHFNEIFTEYGRTMGQRGITHIFVIVMAGICGGTGCGTFIDIPYLVRKSIEDIGGIPEDVVDIFGMLELPDSKIDSSKGMNSKAIDKSKANAYAAMKDLEYYMRSDSEYSAKIPGSDRYYKTKSRIFTRCFLLSNIAINLQGLKYNRNAIDNSNTIYLSGAIPEAVNIMISEDSRRVKGNNNKNLMFGFESSMDNIRSDGFYPDPDKKENELLVSTFGVSKIEIPMAQIILAIFSRVFLGLKNRWELIEDRDLMQKVVKREIPAIFKIEDTFDTLMGILDIRALRDTQLESPNFITDLNAMINGLPLSDGYIDAIKELRITLKKKINEIYSKHGPFFALKIFETDIYGNFLNFLLEQIKKRLQQISASDISRLAKNYADLKPGLFKKEEKSKMKYKLLDAIEAYSATRVYLLWEKQINELKTEISRDYHEGLFKRVTEMVKAMREIFKGITGIDSYTQELITTDASIFSWNFSDISYENIYEKINFLFAKKILWMRPGAPNPIETITKSKIHPVVNERTLNDKEIYYWAKGEDVIQVEYNDEQQGVTRLRNVVSVEEVMQFGNEINGMANIVSIEQMIKEFLSEIKDNKEKDIYDIILSNFSGIINLFNRMAFIDMIILSSPKIDFSKSVSALDDEQKRELFEEAINKFNDFALPSFPVSRKYIARQLETRNFSVTLEPVFSDEYANIVDNIREGIIPRSRTQKLIKNGLSTMIAVNFYFDYSFDYYIEMEECKRKYDEIKEIANGAGLHIAEGSGEDIRHKLRELIA
jgi:hypothetical protein